MIGFVSFKQKDLISFIGCFLARCSIAQAWQAHGSTSTSTLVRINRHQHHRQATSIPKVLLASRPARLHCRRHPITANTPTLVPRCPLSKPATPRFSRFLQLDGSSHLAGLLVSNSLEANWLEFLRYIFPISRAGLGQNTKRSKKQTRRPFVGPL